MKQVYLLDQFTIKVMPKLGVYAKVCISFILIIANGRTTTAEFKKTFNEDINHTYLV